MDAHRTSGGAIFLVQGPPGAGKSALLHECLERASARGWRVAEIKGDALHDPGSLARKLGMRRLDKILERNKGSGKIAVKAGLEIGIQGEAGQDRGDSIEEVLRKAAGPLGVVLTLDEVQNLKVGVQTMPKEKPAISLNLELIHNGKMGVPVVLVAGGLGSSESVLETFGISRIPEEDVCYLGSLENDATRAVIRDWLVWGGRAPENHSYLPHWVEFLATECHGWPQHIHIYAQAAARWLSRNNNELTAEVPAALFEEAWAKRKNYYVKRASKLKEPYRRAVASLLQQKGKGSTLTEDELVSALTGPQSRDQAKEMFAESLVHKGVIAHTSDGNYIVPVPSMHDWLVRRYAESERIRFPKSVPQRSPIHLETRKSEDDSHGPT